jgi:hypothetical protein
VFPCGWGWFGFWGLELGWELGRMRSGELADCLASLEASAAPIKKCSFRGTPRVRLRPACAALAGLRNCASGARSCSGVVPHGPTRAPHAAHPCRLWRRSLRRKPPERAFFARARASICGLRLMRSRVCWAGACAARWVILRGPRLLRRHLLVRWRCCSPWEFAGRLLVPTLVAGCGLGGGVQWFAGDVVVYGL